MLKRTCQNIRIKETSKDIDRLLKVRIPAIVLYFFTTKRSCRQFLSVCTNISICFVILLNNVTSASSSVCPFAVSQSWHKIILIVCKNAAQDLHPSIRPAIAKQRAAKAGQSAKQQNSETVKQWSEQTCPPCPRHLQRAAEPSCTLLPLHSKPTPHLLAKGSGALYVNLRCCCSLSHFSDFSQAARCPMQVSEAAELISSMKTKAL